MKSIPVTAGLKWHQVWKTLLKADGREFVDARDRATRSLASSRVLMATGTSGYALGSLVESTLAVALTLRGASVDVLVCDGALPACQQSNLGDLPASAGDWQQPRCEKCFTQGSACFAPLGLEVLRYSEYLLPDVQEWARHLASTIELESIDQFSWEGISVGEHAYAGTLRYYARGDLRDEIGHEAVLRSYFESALLTAISVRRLLSERRYSVVCFHHGIYTPQGIVGEVCRSLGVRVVNWNPAYRDHCFVFSHGDSYHRTMISESVDEWEGIELSASDEEALRGYLADRRTGRGDWIWFHAADEGSRSSVSSLGVDPDRPFVTLLTSVIWDARLHYESNAFESMLEWIFETVNYFAEHRDRQMVIRVHPAELSGNIPSRQTVVDELARRFDALPANVFIVPPDSGVSTYDLIESSEAVLVYSTKTGIEIASRGIPVVVAGDAWIRNKGFSLDASSKAEYRGILDGLPGISRLDAPTSTRALKYAYHYFFRRMIPLSFVHSRERFQFELALDGVDGLLPGRDAGLDCICEGILHGTAFVFEPQSIGA